MSENANAGNPEDANAVPWKRKEKNRGKKREEFRELIWNIIPFFPSIPINPFSLVRIFIPGTFPLMFPSSTSHTLHWPTRPIFHSCNSRPGGFYHSFTYPQSWWPPITIIGHHHFCNIVAYLSIGCLCLPPVPFQCSPFLFTFPKLKTWFNYPSLRCEIKQI
jgi:hypothetical protein